MDKNIKRIFMFSIIGNLFLMFSPIIYWIHPFPEFITIYKFLLVAYILVLFYLGFKDTLNLNNKK